MRLYHDNQVYCYSNSEGAHTNHSTHRGPALIPHLVPSYEDGSDIPGWAGRSEPNFLDLALEEDSDDEWEEVTYATNNAVVDRPLIATPSGFTLPSCGKRSEFLTLEVVEDWQPSSLPAASHTNDPQTALPGDVDRRFTQGSTSAQHDSIEADLQLERELAQGLADLNTPAPGPPQQLRSRTPDVAHASPSPRVPIHLESEAVEQPSPARTSVKGKGKMVDHQPAEQLHKTGKRADPPRVSLAIEDPLIHKPKVSFKAKASELMRSAGRLLAASKPLPSRNLAALPPFSTTGGPSPAPNDPPHPRAQATSGLPGPTPQLFTPKGFSNHVQNLREKTAEDTLRRFRERYGGEVIGRAGRELAGVISASKGTQPTQRRKVQGKAGGKRKLAPEPGEITPETVGSASSKRDVREPRLAAASGGNSPLTMGVCKRRREMSGRESEGSSPRKKPRLGRS